MGHDEPLIGNWPAAARTCATARPRLAKADTAFQGASVGQPTEPCLGVKPPCAAAADREAAAAVQTEWTAGMANLRRPDALWGRFRARAGCAMLVLSREGRMRAGLKFALDSSLRDVKQDDTNNEVAPSRCGEQIDDVLDGLVGAVVGGFESAVWAMLRVRTVVEAAVGKWSAQPFVEEQK